MARPTRTTRSGNDVVIVGGGPVGLAVAIGACRAGLRVHVLDARRPPIDKACGEGLMPDGVTRLAALGVALDPRLRFAFRGIRWIDGDVIVAAEFPASRPEGWGVRRTRLHEAMVEAAEREGVRVDWGRAARGLDAGAVRTDRGAVAGRWIVGADGLRSSVRRWAGLEGGPAPRPRFGARQHLAARPWTDRVEVWWDDEGEAYVTPVDEGQVGVALLDRGARSRPLALRFPDLARRLAGARVTSSRRGAGPLEQRVTAVRRGHVTLVGDAAGYLDAITGEGLALGLRQADALVRALVAGDPADYVAAHRRVGRLPGALMRLLLAVERRPVLRRRAMAALAADPGLFGRMLALHVGALPPRRLGLGALLRLVARTVVSPRRRRSVAVVSQLHLAAEGPVDHAGVGQHERKADGDDQQADS